MLAFVTALAALAAPPPAPSPAVLERCEELPQAVREGTRKLQRVGAGGDREAYHVQSGGKRWFVFVHKAKGYCDVYPVGRASARVQGHFWPGAERKVKAFTLEPAHCNEETCEHALIIREVAKSKDKEVLGALVLDETCELIALSAVELFDDARSIRVDCKDGAGAAAYNLSALLVHVIDAQPTTVFEASVGHESESSPNEDMEMGQHCVYHRKGSLTIRNPGPTPTLDHLRRAPGTRVEGTKARVGTLTPWTWDPTKKAFTKGEERPARWTPVDKCRPLRPGEHRP